jgi:hypothetical protein
MHNQLLSASKLLRLWSNSLTSIGLRCTATRFLCRSRGADTDWAGFRPFAGSGDQAAGSSGLNHAEAATRLPDHAACWGQPAQEVEAVTAQR